MKKNKKLLLVVLAFVLASAIISVAIIAATNPGAELPGGNVDWYIDEDTKTLYINGTGEMQAVYTTIKQDSEGSTLYHGAPWTQPQYRDKFDKAVIGEGIVNIDRYAFLGLDKLISVQIPSTVQTIEGQAFAGCTSLTAVNLPEGLTVIEEHVFYDCSSLRSIVLPSTLQEIRSAAFEGSGLLSIDIPASVKNINFAAFADNASLETVILHEGLEKIGANAFSGCSSLKALNIPASVKEIGESALASTDSLAELTVAEGNTVYRSQSNVLLTPDGKTLIVAAGGIGGAYIIPSGVERIAEGAFDGNKKITSVTFGDVSEIGYSAFKDCTGIASLVIPATVKTVEGMAFQGCTGITSLTVNEGVEKLGMHAFEGCISIESANIPSTVERIDDYLFAGCSGLKTVGMSNGTEVIGFRAFSDCTGLAEISLSDSVKKIYSGAFDGCSALERVTLSKDLTELGDGAFNGCDSLSSVTVPEGSASFSSDGRAIYAEGGKTLKLYIASNKSESYTLLSSTEIIGANAFQNAKYLKSIDFEPASGLKEIGSMAFKDVINIKSVSFPASVKRIGDGVFTNCSSLTSVSFAKADASGETCTLGSGLFKGCSELVSVGLPEGVKALPGETFAGCAKLERVDLPSTLTSIGANIFYGCSSLKECVLPNAVGGIPAGAFYGCTSLSEFKIPENCTQMGNNCFTGCVNLKTVYIDSWQGWINYTKNNNGTVEWETVDENGKKHQNANTPFFYADALYIDGVLTEDIVIPSEGGFDHKDGYKYVPGYLLAGFKGVKTITIEEGFSYAASYAFANCTNLEAVYLPESVTRIGARNFLNCTNLKYVDLADINNIGIYAFEGCTSLRAVDAPKLTHVEGSGFNKCTGLKVINIPKITQLDKYAFAGCTNIISLTVGQELTTLADNAFSNSEVIVELDNQSSKEIAISNTPWYTAGGNIKKGADGLWFVQSPSGTKYLLGYYGADKVEYLYLPKDEYTVYEGAFANCVLVDNVVIPSTVKEISDGAFSASSVVGVYANPDTAAALGLEGKVGGAELHLYVPLSIYDASLSLGNNFALEYRVTAEALEGFNAPKMVFEIGGVKTEVTDYKVQGGVYVFTFKNIAPHMMNDTITAYVSSNGINGYTKTYSVAEYCMNRLANEAGKTELSTLLVDILNYGAAAQMYTDHNTGDLANAGLTDTQKAWGSTSTAPALKDVFGYTSRTEAPLVVWNSATLCLQNSISMRFTFSTEKDVGALTFKAKYADGKEAELLGVMPTGNANEYYLYFTGINASMMSDVIEFTVYENGTAISHTFAYSVESYVLSHQDDGDELASLVIALMNYGVATDAYINR